MRKWQKEWHHHHHHLQTLINQYLALQVDAKLADSSGHLPQISTVAEDALKVMGQIVAKVRASR